MSGVSEGRAFLTDEERELLGDWWDSDWPDDAAGVIGTLQDTVARIVAGRTRAAVERALLGFPLWVASNRAYNGSDHQHGQALYNECLNAVLSEWVADYLTRALGTSKTPGTQVEAAREAHSE